MNKNQIFLQDSAVLIITTLISLLISPLPYICLLFCGILMIITSFRSLTDHQKVLSVLYSATALLFIFAAGSPAAFLVLYSSRLFKGSGLLLPPVLWLPYGILTMQKSAAEVLFISILLLAGALLLLAAEKSIRSYYTALGRISQAFSATAVSEMTQKKLNRELMIKRYLDDKNARLEERESISRNIHNSVGHTITAAIMTLDAADMIFDANPALAREKMNTANSRIRGSLDSIRHAVRVLDHESSFVLAEDLIQELNSIADSFSMSNTIVIQTDYPDMNEKLRLPHEHNEFLCGAMQELLSNGVRHGGADHFIVSVSAYSGNISLKVTDNGKSIFSEENRTLLISEGYGLKKLIAYAEKCGGSAEFTNDQGFKAEIKLPLYDANGKQN